MIPNLSAGRSAVLAGHGRPMDFPSSAADRGSHPWSAFLAVSRGCSNACSYCIVPRVRGPERSLPPREILEEARRLVEAGAVEITLLGQNVDAYGKDLTDAGCGMRAAGFAGPSLAGLIREIGRLEKQGLRRLRFVTSHPRDISEELLRAMSEVAAVCPFLHIPAQSGSDRVLAAMRRGYDSARYREICAAAREIVHGVEIASDFIVGFPGETEEDFAFLLDWLNEASLDRVGCFRYEPVRGAVANELAPPVPDEVKEERWHRFMQRQQVISTKRLKAKIGTRQQVIIDEPGPTLAKGRSKADAPEIDGAVYVAARRPLRAGEIATVKIERADTYDLYGTAVGFS
jgi:ribosomal protein S12 methylthiotransferase